MSAFSVEAITDAQGRYAVLRTHGYINSLGAEQIEQFLCSVLRSAHPNWHTYRG